MKKQKLFNIDISLGTIESFLEYVICLGEKHQSSYVCFTNVHMCIEAHRDVEFARIVNEADIASPDGMPISKSLKYLFNVNQEKISGPDFMPLLLKEAEKKKLNVFFYGSTEAVLSKLKEHLCIEYPNLKIAGMISPPFRQLSKEEEFDYVATINSVDTNILFVALGCPKQEKWMARMKGEINAIMLGVGGAFPMLVGIEKRAPIWMQKSMLEWLFRLIQDPKRLFKRYFVTNTTYVFLLIKAKIYSMLR
ncbi:WecB/TagA/CpsF family glycosyltransferase [Flectobacillus roseus]